MELKVIGKRLFTNELDGTITEGENNADIIGITLARYHRDLDMSLFSFRISAVSEKNGIIAEQVLEKDSVTDDEIRLLWTVTSDFTAESGSYSIILAGINSAGDTRIKFTSQPVCVGEDSRMEFLPPPSVIEQAFDQVQLEVQKALDAADRAEAAAADRTISAATEEKIGGVLSGGDISVGEDGTVSVISVGGKSLGASVPADAVFTDTLYTLPAATTSSLGGVIPDGKTVTVNSSGVISAPAREYTLPTATAKTLGGVMVDGKTITANANGVISAVGGGGDGGGSYVLPAATTGSLGGVIPDGTTVTVDENGVISAVGGGGNSGGSCVLPAATTGSLGGIIPDGTTVTVDENGVVSVRDDSHGHKISDVSGLRAALDEKADVSAIPTALPADGGNADTVGGCTVKSNVPENAAFTDTLYTLPVAGADTLGGIKVDGDLFRMDPNGFLALAYSQSGIITFDPLGDVDMYMDHNPNNSAAYVSHWEPFTNWPFLLISAAYIDQKDPGSSYCGTAIISTADIVMKSKDSTGALTGDPMKYYLFNRTSSTTVGYFQFDSESSVGFYGFSHVSVFGVKFLNSLYYN